MPAFQQSLITLRTIKKYSNNVRSHKYILFSYNNNLKAFFKFLLFLKKKGRAIAPRRGYAPGIYTHTQVPPCAYDTMIMQFYY